MLEVDAAGLRHVPDFEGSSVGAVISGLPFLAIPPRQTYAILEGAFASLGADGAMYVFTYGFRCPIDRSVLDRLDLILLMTVNPGFGGQAFIPSVVEKVRRVKALVGDRSIDIEIDGGVTPETAPLVVAAGTQARQNSLVTTFNRAQMPSRAQ